MPSESSVALLEMEDVWKFFRQGGRTITALENINLKEDRGCVALLGLNGAGKTTLINLTVGFLIPDRGRVLVEGYDPGEEVVRALLHDLPEAITGDLHKLAKNYVTVKEDLIWEFLSLENPGTSIVLKDADKLELIASAIEYKSIGVRGLDKWIELAKSGLKLGASREVAGALEDIVLGDYYVDLLSR